MARRLAAILAADVVGYSKLMAEDEAGTLAALKTHRRELFDPETDRHGGRIVKLIGDGVLVEFPSVVDAVECALIIQSAVAAGDGKIRLRIGVNIGDIIIDGDDIYGDGVNVAARLEALADPGGIAISDIAHESLGNRVKAEFSDAGEQQVKNFARPIRVWRWSPGAAAPTGTSAPSLPDRPSIAVLPFTNMGGDAEQDYFADGMVEDIITELSKYSWLVVIARNSTFTFKGSSVDVKDIGQQLGVRYVLEGSIRKAGDRVRITAQLVEAETGAHVWAERYDREVADVFAVQDEITQAVTGAIQPSLISAEANRARRTLPENMAAWDYAVRGRWHVLRLTKEDNIKAQKLLRAGLKRYPDHVPLLAFLSFGLINGVVLGWSSDPATWLAEARDLAQQAATLDDNDVWVQCALGLGQFTAKQPEKAIGHLRKAIELNPSFALGHGYLALQLAFAGDPEEAIREALKAIRLSPRDPELFHFFVAIATAHFVAKRYDDAVMWAEKSIRERPTVPAALRLLAASLVHLDRTDEARRAFKQVLEITPHVSARSLRATIHFGNAKDLDRYICGMRMAGLSD